jgi:hypothetical protein
VKLATLKQHRFLDAFLHYLTAHRTRPMQLSGKPFFNNFIRRGFKGMSKRIFNIRQDISKKSVLLQKITRFVSE